MTNPQPSPLTAHLFYSRGGVEEALIGEVQEGISGGDEEIGVPAEVRGTLVRRCGPPVSLVAASSSSSSSRSMAMVWFAHTARAEERVRHRCDQVPVARLLPAECLALALALVRPGHLWFLVDCEKVRLAVRLRL